MKKLLLAVLAFIPIFVSAEENVCDYSKQVSLQSLGVHVNYSYEYSESNKMFSLILNNVVDDILPVVTNANVQINENKQAVIQNLPPGKTFTINIYGSVSSGCNNILLRTIRINVPYVNDYYNSESCKGYEELAICKNRFLDYKVSYSMFNRLIQDYNNKINNKDVNEEEKSLFENAIAFAKTYYIEILFVLAGTVPTIIIGNIKLRKAKYGF